MLKSLDSALVFFATHRFHGKIDVHWRALTIHEDFSDSYEKDRITQARYYPDEEPFSKEEWLDQYAGIFVEAHLSPQNRVVLEFKFPDKIQFYTVKLFEKFRPEEKRVKILDETIALINSHMFLSLVETQAYFEEFIRQEKPKLIGRPKGRATEDVIIPASLMTTAEIDFRHNVVIDEGGHTYLDVKIDYEQQKIKHIKTKVEQLADLMGTLLEHDEINELSPDKIVYYCSERLRSGTYINLTDYQDIVIEKPKIRVEVARNTALQAKKLYLMRLK